MNIRNNIIKRLSRKVAESAASKYKTKLNVQPPKNSIALMNSKCHYNAVNAVKTGAAVAVVEVVMINQKKDDCAAHYINMLEDGSFVDITLGWAWSSSDYRLVRYVHDSEFESISAKLSNLKESLTSGVIGSTCKILNIDKWDLC